MSIIWMTSADLQTNDMWTLATAPGYDNTYARTGSYSFKISGSSVTLAKAFSPINELFVRFAAKCVNTADFFCGFYDSSDPEYQLRVSLFSTYLTLRRGYFSTILGTSSLSTGIDWNCIEIYVKIDNSVGIGQIKINGQLVIDYNGDTQYNAGNTFDSIRFTGTSAATNWYIDDIIFRDDRWPGQGGVYLLAPNAGSTLEDWTPSAGNPEDCIDDFPPSYTDYISTDAISPGSGQLVGIESLPVTPTSIGGVGVVAFGKLDAAGDGWGMPIIKSGSTKASGDYYSFGATSTILDSFWHVNPDDSLPWESADIDALEVGIETIAPSGA